MSRAYRIKVQDGIKRDLSAADEICAELELLDILPADQMRGLLAEELKKRGFHEAEEGLLKRSHNGVEIAVDSNTGEVKVSSTQTEAVEIQSERETLGFDDFGPAAAELKERLKKEVEKDLETRAKKHEDQLRAKATEKLKGALEDVSSELDRIVNGVTREALKRKAASLGQIKEVSEDAEAGSLRITVEV